MLLYDSNLHHGYGVETPDHYYEVELTPRLRDFTLRLVRALAPAPAHEALVEALEIGRRIDCPLPKERFDWDQLEAEAQRMGCSVADRIWDGARLKDRGDQRAP